MTTRKPPGAHAKALRKHLQRGDPPPAPATKVALSPAAAWPFTPRDAAIAAPLQDVVIEDQRAIAAEQAKRAMKPKRARKAKA